MAEIRTTSEHSTTSPSWVIFDDGANTVRSVLADLSYKQGWAFTIGAYGADSGYYLIIKVETIDSDARHDPVFVLDGQLLRERFFAEHHFPIPSGLIRRDAEDWVFGRILDVESHEAAEFFRIGDDRPFMPDHYNGDPYRIRRTVSTD